MAFSDISTPTTEWPMSASLGFTQEAHRQGDNVLSPYTAAEMVTGHVNTKCVFIPLHVHSFPTEREEEANSGAPGKDFVNVVLQQPVEGGKII